MRRSARNESVGAAGSCRGHYPRCASAYNRPRGHARVARPPPCCSRSSSSPATRPTRSAAAWSRRAFADESSSSTTAAPTTRATIARRLGARVAPHFRLARLRRTEESGARARSRRLGAEPRCRRARHAGARGAAFAARSCGRRTVLVELYELSRLSRFCGQLDPPRRLVSRPRAAAVPARRGPLLRRSGARASASSRAATARARGRTAARTMPTLEDALDKMNRYSSEPARSTA